MARCGCAGQSCGCLVIAGTGAVVTGAGTAQDPYVVSLQGSRLSVIDSPTIDLTLTGTGDSISPYVLRADFIGTIPVPDTTPAESRTWSGGAVSLTDVTGPRTIRVTLQGNVTSVALPTWASSTSGTITLVLMQDATGGRTWVQPGTSAYGIDVALTPTASARDVVALHWTGVQWVVVPVAMDVS